MADDKIKAPHGGVEGIVEMLHVMAEPDRQRLLNDIAGRDPRLFAELQAKLFTFADLVALSAREMQALIPAVPSGKLALALRQADEKLRAHFFDNMTRRAAESLQEEVRTSGPRRLSDVEAAQAEVIRVAKELESHGKLLLRRRPREE
jgi:flagellar motor switch protein FliG